MLYLDRSRPSTASFSNLSDWLRNRKESLQGFSSQTVLVALDNPNATVSQFLTYQSTVTEGNVNVVEQVIFNELNLDVTNTYIIDESNGRPISSTQKIHPYLPVISLDFYYK